MRYRIHIVVVLSVVLVAMACSWAQAAVIPEDVFPGIEFEVLLEDQYLTGQAIAIKGRVTAADKTDGQLLIRFIPQAGGEAIQLPIQLEEVFFSRYMIFRHDQAGSYDIEVFLGGPGQLQLAGIGRFSGVEIGQGSGIIQLPPGYFSGVALDTEFPTEYSTGEAIVMRGAADAAVDNGQLIMNFVAPNGEEIQVTQTLNGNRFAAHHVFLHDQAGTYQLQVFLGQEFLNFIGEYTIEVRQGAGEILIPPRYFFGLVLDQPLAGVWEIGQSVDFSGEVDAGIKAIRLEISAAGGATRIIQIAVGTDGRFRTPVRLQEGEEGRLVLQVITQRENASLASSGRFPLEGIPARPAPRLVVGAIALGFLPQDTERVTLLNQGDADLEVLSYQLDGLFELLNAPTRLATGAAAQLEVRYSGVGGDEGTLEIFGEASSRALGQIALSGLPEAGGDQDTDVVHLQADVDGQIEVDLDGAHQEYLMVLYAIQPAAAEDAAKEYRFTLGQAQGAAKTIDRNPARQTQVLVSARDTFEAAARLEERRLAKTVQARDLGAAKAGQAEYRLGDRRELIFPASGRIPQTPVQASVVALNERVVAWRQDDLRMHDDNLSIEQIQQVIDQFGQDLDPISARFGAGSDVDSDGKVAFLFTHLVNDVGSISGFYNAASSIPVDQGGNGNLMDLMYLSPRQPLGSYRSLLVHEFQHLISFNQHVLIRRGQAETSWLNEGLSHLAEDQVASFSESGQSAIITAYLNDPGAVGLAGDALLDAGKRGAAYLFVRSLADRFGDAVIVRLMTSGLIDHDNIEAATGESFGQLLAFWGGQLYLSGLGVVSHQRLNYTSTLLRAGDDRGFALPTAQTYRVGGVEIEASIRSHGVQFIHVQGRSPARLTVAGEPDAGLGAVVIPLASGFTPTVWVPADYIAGLRFTERVPGHFVVGQPIRFAGVVEDEAIGSVAFQFNGPDTLIFHTPLEDGAFAQQLEFSMPQIGSYEFLVFTGRGNNLLEFAGRFGPIPVVGEQSPTAVETLDALPHAAALGQAFPNPFNGGTVIPFELGAAGQAVKLEIYNILGQRVRRLSRGQIEEGRHRVFWDGHDEQGRALGTGVYFYRLEVGPYRAVRRLLLLR